MCLLAWVSLLAWVCLPPGFSKWSRRGGDDCADKDLPASDSVFVLPAPPIPDAAARQKNRNAVHYYSASRNRNYDAARFDSEAALKFALTGRLSTSPLRKLPPTHQY